MTNYAIAALGNAYRNDQELASHRTASRHLRTSDPDNIEERDPRF